MERVMKWDHTNLFGAREPAGSKPDAPPPAADGQGQASPAGTNEPTEAAVNDWDDPAEPVEPTRLDLALKMADCGFRVFPLRPGEKEPFKDFAWKTEATTDPARVKAWFAETPDANYAVAAGDGLVVLDVDGAIGDASLAALTAEHGRLPETLKVRTPGGGYHLYMRGPDVVNSAGKIGEKLDVRSAGGYVVGPGSFFADPGGKKGYTGDYKIERDIAAGDAPAWFPLLAGEPKQRSQHREPRCEADLPENVYWAARNYLALPPEDGGAPIAVEGRGGNITAYKVFTRLRELGISDERSVELAGEHWNGRCLPPWSHGELVVLAANADAYGQCAFGEKAPSVLAAEGGEVVVIDPPPAATAAAAAAARPKVFHPTTFDPNAPIDPPEDYLYGLHYVRGILSATAAPGGFGKSQFALAEAICMAVGHELLGERIYEPLRVWFVSLDDPGRITRKRARAFMRHHGLEGGELGDRLMIDGNDTMPPDAVKVVTASREGVRVDAATVNAFVAAIRARRVDVLILDPLVKFHAVEENDNPAMNQVGTTLAQIATTANCAVEIVVHTSKPKGQRITAEHVRGASSFVDAARAVRVVNPMTEEEAQRLGIDEVRRPWLFRVDLSKGNLAPPSEAKWFKRVSVPLDNGTARMPKGEEFPAVAPYRLPDPVATTTEADVSKALAHLARGPDQAGSPWRGSDKAHGYAGVGIAEALGLDTGDPQTRVTCRKLIKEWLSRGLLVQRYVQSRAEGRPIPFIHVPADWKDKLAALRSAGGGNGGGPIAVEDPHRAGRASDFDGATTIPR